MSEDAVAARKLGEGELHGLLATFQQARDDSQLLLVDAAPVWDGPDVVETDDGPVRIVTAASVLAARAALVDHNGGPLVVITDRDAHDLGMEFVARAWKGRPVRPTPWDGVLSLFRAQELDAPVRAQRWLVDVLVELAPERGYPQPPGGVVTLERAWRALHRLLGLSESPAPSEVLQWFRSGTADEALGRLDEDTTAYVLGHLDDAVTRCASDLRRASRVTEVDLVALGLAIDAIADTDDPVPQPLLESLYLGEQWPSASALRAWRQAARELNSNLSEEERVELDRAAHEVLDRVRGIETADSDLLTVGLHNRVQHVAVSLEQALDRPQAELDELARAIDAVGNHRRVEHPRVKRLTAALRLLRRRTGEVEPTASTLTQLSHAYAHEGAWVDACLQQVGQGDTDDELASALHRVWSEVSATRRTADQQFAAAVAEEACAPSPPPSLDQTRPLRIEDVLGTVLAPLGRQQPVLLLVIDGLSHAAAIPLLADLRSNGWQRLGPSRRPTPQVVAALPTVTIHSRATLLSGELTSGGQDVERTNFTSQHDLIEAAGGQAPVLLHRSALRRDEGEIAPQAREAISDPSQRIVGVVFNGVDDFLSSNGQLALAEGLAGLPLLPALLEAALEAGRTIVLTSDHGHVLAGDTARHAPGGGERFRLPDTGEPDEHEVLLRGPRVLRGDDGIVAAADGTYRYVNLDRRGYHGGATPAEVLCPLHVLAPADVELDGWEPAPIEPPSWWEADRIEVPDDVGELAIAAEAPAEQFTTDTDAPQPGLFDTPTTQEGASDWPAELVQSGVYAAQLRLVAREPAEADVLTVLRLADASGGSVAGAVLERALRTTPTRLRSRLEAVRSALTVDGYAGVRVETDGSVQLDREVLRQQFGIDDG